MKDADDDFSATTVSAGQLRAIVERIERLDEEALRKKKPEERSEEEAMLELYMNALGMLPGGSTRSEPPLGWSEPLPVHQKGRRPLTPTVSAEAAE